MVVKFSCGGRDVQKRSFDLTLQLLMIDVVFFFGQTTIRPILLTKGNHGTCVHWKAPKRQGL